MPITLDGSNGITTPMYNGSITANAVTPVTGFKNRIINGGMVIDQRNAGASISVAAVTPSTYFPVDRFFCQSTGTAFTAQRVTGSGSFRNALRLTGAASNTGAYTTQRIESFNTYDLVSQSVTLSAVLSRSSGTTCTWTAYAAGSADNYSSLTTIATGSFTLTSTATAYSATFNAGANAGNGIMIEFFWGALGAGVTVDITGVQLEVGSTATSFDYRPYTTELQLAQRYYFQIADSYAYFAGKQQSTNQCYFTVQAPVSMRATPTPTLGAGTKFVFAQSGFSSSTSTAVTLTSISTNYIYMSLLLGGFSGMADNYGAIFRFDATLQFSSEL